MPSYSNLKKQCLVYGVTKLAVAMERVGGRSCADRLRGWMYSNQVEELKRHIGKEVRVVSSAWGSPRMRATSSEYGLDPGMFNEKGVYVVDIGNLDAVNPCMDIRVEDRGPDGTLMGWNGLPFLGTSSIRDVRSSGRLIYWNPEVGETFFGRYRDMPDEEKIQLDRRTFGRMVKGMRSSAKRI